MAFSFLTQWTAPQLNAAARISFLLLKKLRIQATRTGVQKFYGDQAGTVNLYAIGKYLINWKVEHVCLEVEARRFDELPLPFIAHVNDTKSRLIVVTEIDQDKVTYYDDREKKKRLSRTEFMRYWSGHVLLAEKMPNAGEKDYALHRKEERKAAVKKLVVPFVFLVFCLSAWLTNKEGIWLDSLILIKLMGCAVSGLLLIMESDQHHPLAQAFCTSDKTGCNALAKTQKLSWSTIGFIYFGGGLLTLVLGIQPDSLIVNSWLDSLSVLFIPYSIYYQARIAKKWCPLCLITLTLLLVGFLSAYIFYWRYEPDINQLFLYTTSGMPFFLLSTFFALLLRRSIKVRAESKKFHRQANRLKYDPVVFEALLKKDKRVNPPPDMGIIIGPEDAACTILQISHPYCRPCAQAHEAIAILIKEHPHLRLQIIFNTTANANDPSTIPITRFLRMENADEVMDDWYHEGYRDLKSFIKKYPLSDIEEQLPRIEAMQQWCAGNGIEATPTIFINGYQLPAIYSAADLRFLINESSFVATTGVCV